MTKVRQTKYGSWMIIGDETVYDAYNAKKQRRKKTSESPGRTRQAQRLEIVVGYRK